jgi:hypothetical protein
MLILLLYEMSLQHYNVKIKLIILLRNRGSVRLQYNTKSYQILQIRTQKEICLFSETDLGFHYWRPVHLCSTEFNFAQREDWCLPSTYSRKSQVHGKLCFCFSWGVVMLESLATLFRVWAGLMWYEVNFQKSWRLRSTISEIGYYYMMEPK